MRNINNSVYVATYSRFKATIMIDHLSHNDLTFVIIQPYSNVIYLLCPRLTLPLALTNLSALPGKQETLAMKSLGLSDKELELAEGFLGDDDDGDNDDAERKDDQEDRTMANVTQGLPPSHALVHTITPALVQTIDPVHLHTNAHINHDQDKDLVTPPGWFCPTPASINPLVLAAKNKDKVNPLRLTHIY